MTIPQAETIIAQTGAAIALRHRFAFDTGTMLRLDNYSIVNIFDDGRYYIQGEDTVAILAAFIQVEKPWDPDTWSGEMPNHRLENMPELILPWFAPPSPPKRF